MPDSMKISLDFDFREYFALSAGLPENKQIPILEQSLISSTLGVPGTK